MALKPDPRVEFDVMSEPYETLVTKLRHALAGATPVDTVVGPKSKVRRPVLAKETGADVPPPRWIHVELKGKGSVVKPKLAIRNDNAYIVGFTNSNGQWFQLSKNGDKPLIVDDDDKKKKPVKMLGFDGNYNTLVKGGGVNALPALNLSRNSTANAAARLWNHNANKLYGGGDGDETATPGGDPSDELKKAIATLCVVVCEAARFTPVSNVISEGWDDDTDRVSITAKEVSYIKEWSDLSTQLLKWKKAGYMKDEEFFGKFVKKNGIKDGEDALAVVQLVKQISRSSLMAWLKYLLGLLVKNLQGTTVYDDKPKGSALVSPL